MAVCWVRLQDTERAVYWMEILGLNEIVDQLALANSVCWCGNVLRRALDFEVESRRIHGKGLLQEKLRWVV